MESGKLVLLIGPSGVGKSVILHNLRQRHPEYRFPRSATTRTRRENEGDDIYHFVSDAEFDALLEKDSVLEWAIVHGGARYGTLVDEIIPAIKEGKTVVREVDVQGFESIRRHPLFEGEASEYELQSIFLLPESREQLIEHINKRSPMTPEEIERRMESMEKEMKYADLCNVRVVSREGKLDEALDEIEKSIAA